MLAVVVFVPSVGPIDLVVGFTCSTQSLAFTDHELNMELSLYETRHISDQKSGSPYFRPNIAARGTNC